MIVASRVPHGRRGTGAVTLFLTTLTLATLPWGCATPPETDLATQTDLRGDLELPGTQERSEPPAIQRELRDLISDGFRTFEGMTGAVTACLQDQVCAEWDSYAGALLGIAQRAPEDDYIQGQVVYSLVRGERHDLALVALEACQASEWWCKALLGFTLAESGRVVEAEAALDQALLVMPEDELCEWNDLLPLVSADAWSAYQGSSCFSRLEQMEQFWWLADPAWAVPGNDRKVEHYNRMAWATLHADALGPSIWGGHNDAHHVEVVRRGMDFYRWDARWGKLCNWPTRFRCAPCLNGEQRRRARERGVPCCLREEWPWPWCPYTPDAQTYRVMPEERALLHAFHAAAEDWPLEPGGEPEHYVPQVGALVPVDAQVAFFERGVSVVATAAVEVPSEDPFRENPPDTAFLFFGTDPATPPVTAKAIAQDGRWVFRATVPRRRYVVGIETVTPEAVGRFRSGHGLPHDPSAPLRLSDLLLFTPDDSSMPDSVETAVPLMKGGHRWRQGEVMGVFLEVYGPDDAASFPVSVELEREPGGLARLGEVLGIAGGKPVNVQWVESAGGGRFALSFTVDLGEVSAAEYTLRVSVVGPGMSPAVVEKSLRIVDGGG